MSKTIIFAKSTNSNDAQTYTVTVNARHGGTLLATDTTTMTYTNCLTVTLNFQPYLSTSLLTDMQTSILLQDTAGNPIVKTQTAYAIDSVSSPPSARVCGNIQYTITKTCPPSVTPLSSSELNLNSITGDITLHTTNSATVGWHAVTLTASLTSYPSI